LSDKLRVHLIGVCGTAMATLAALLKQRGHDVRGSDQNVYPPMSDFLAAEGIRTMTGYSAEHITADVDLVVVGNAISRGNRSSKPSSSGRSGIARCPRRSGSSFSGARARSSSPARMARRRRRR
jgi:UDP-N-acetylmuramate: L-alanyl-gamma-D-glutamyl-meso-diaminopimelate ligase